MKKFWQNYTVITAIIVSLVLLAIAGCAPQASQQKATTQGEPIVIAVLGDLTGPYATMSKSYVAGFDDAAKLINQKGGINGHNIKLEYYDHAGDVKKALSLYSGFASQEKKPMVYIGVSSTVDLALKDRLPEDKIVEITTGSSTPAFSPPGWIFGTVPPYPSMFGGFIDWMLKDWQTTKTHDGNVRLAILTWDIAFGKSIYTAETQAYCKSKGVDIVDTEWTTASPISLTEPLMRVRDANADWVVGWHQVNYSSVAFKDAYALGMVPPKTRFACVQTGIDYNLYDLCPQEMKAIEPVSISVFYFWGEDTPIVKAYDQIFTANQRTKAERLAGYFHAARAIGITSEILKSAEQSVGFDKMDGTAVYQAAQKVTNLDVDNAMFGIPGYQFTFNSTKRAPDNMMLHQATKDSQIVPIASWFTAPDLLPGGKDVPAAK